MSLFNEIEKHNMSLVKNETEDIHTTLIGKLYDVDNVNRKASVKFLQKTVRTLKNDIFQTIPEDLTDVPLLPIFSSNDFEIYAPYSNGDKVVILILERPYFEAFSSEEISEQQSFGRMEIGYAVVLKSIPKRILKETQSSADSIVINNKKTGTQIILNNTVNITGNTVLNGDLEVNGNVKISGNVKAKEMEVESGISKNKVPYSHP